jgi:uncharacterized protein (UPF0262 family)
MFDIVPLFKESLPQNRIDEVEHAENNKILRNKLIGKIQRDFPEIKNYFTIYFRYYLETFVNNPQKQLEGTAMPRVGLTEESQDQVVAYLEEVGDSKKAQREELGPKFLIYLIVDFLLFEDQHP